MNLKLKIFLSCIISAFMLIGCNENNTNAEASTESSPVKQIAKIYADDADSSDYFGNSVSMDGDYVIIGAQYHHSTSYGSGSAYLFKKESNNTLTQLIEITPKHPESLEYTFGYKVSNSGDYVAIAHKSGHSYLYKINTDTNISLVGKMSVEEYEYGIHTSSISMDGDYIVIADERDSSAKTKAGAAFVFKRYSDTNVSQIAKITASDAEYFDNIGNSVSISGDYIVIGAQKDDTSSSYTGSAYVFKINSDTNISQIAKLQALDTESFGYFGSSVSIDGKYIVIGAKKMNSYNGNAYVFKINSDTNISQIAKLQPTNTEEYNGFGTSVSIDKNLILIGTDYDYEAGAAYLFQINNDTDISQVARVQPEEIQKYDAFGASVAISNNYFVVSAKNSNYVTSNSGTAYIYEYDKNQTQ